MVVCGEGAVDVGFVLADEKEILTEVRSLGSWAERTR